MCALMCGVGATGCVWRVAVRVCVRRGALGMSMRPFLAQRTPFSHRVTHKEHQRRVTPISATD